MNTVEVRGLVIRTVDIKETDRLITIFTEQMGVVTALAQSARSLKSRKMAATMQFCYGNYVLYRRGDKYFVKEAELIESFFDIRQSIDGLALANYIAEVLSDVTVEESDNELLRLSLNSLYAISTAKFDFDKIKAVFEIRTASILGFMPDVLACHRCKEQGGEFFFDIMGGSIECFKCHQDSKEMHTEYEFDHERKVLCILSAGAKVALGYSIYSPVERVFSFNIGDDDMRLFSRATEEYLLNHLGRSYKSLDFYKEIKR